MVMRDDPVANGLVRYDLLRLSNDCLSAHLVLRSRLEKQDVVGELHGDCIVRAVNPEYSVSQFFRSRTCGRLLTRAGRSCSTTTARAGRRSCHQLLKISGIRVGPKNVGRECGPAAALLHDLRGEFQAIGAFAVLGILRFDEHVAEDWVFQPGLNLLNLVLVVNIANDLVRLTAKRLNRRVERHCLVTLAANCFRLYRSAVRGGALKKSPRCDPDRSEEHTSEL